MSVCCVYIQLDWNRRRSGVQGTSLAGGCLAHFWHTQLSSRRLVRKAKICFPKNGRPIFCFENTGHLSYNCQEYLLLSTRGRWWGSVGVGKVIKKTYIPRCEARSAFATPISLASASASNERRCMNCVWVCVRVFTYYIFTHAYITAGMPECLFVTFWRDKSDSARRSHIVLMLRSSTYFHWGDLVRQLHTLATRRWPCISAWGGAVRIWKRWTVKFKKSFLASFFCS